MNEFVMGILTSTVATVLIAVMVKCVFPYVKDQCLYNGIRVVGTWNITEFRNGKNVRVGQIELKQKGRTIKGVSTRKITRGGVKSERKFHYHGFISGHQVTLIFEDAKGVGFDTGTYVFTVQNDVKTMVGMATFHGKIENKIVSEARNLIKAVS